VQGQISATRRGILTTALEVAKWMRIKRHKEGILRHKDAVEGITTRFGDEFIYINKDGNPAIREDVLAEFRGLTKHSVVWEKSMLRWRKRRRGDPPGVRQVD